MKKKLVIALSLSIALASACSKPPEATPDPEHKVEGNSIVFPPGNHEVESVQSVQVNRQRAPSTRLNGRLTWNEDRTVRIYTPFSGRVEKILVQPGMAVKSGQALAVIASPDFGQAQSDARRAASDYGLAEKNFARVRELAQHGVAAGKELQNAEAEYARARAELDRTQRRLALYGGRRDGVDQTYTLTAPIAGMVVERNINPGQELRSDQITSNAPPLFVITDPGQLWAQIDAAERDLPKLRVGKAITLHTPAYRDEPFHATVAAISDFLDPSTRTVKVRAVLANPQRKLKAEMFVTAEVDADNEMVLLVPTKSVYFQGGQNYVFVEDGGGRYTRREVQLDDVYGNEVEVVQGIGHGEKVVTQGSLMLQQILKPRRVQK
jgi:cobalt-zinc-cadmium efflux system membrane fusion protein